MSEKVAGWQLQAQAVQRGVLVKFLAFSFALAAAPIGTYFLSLHSLYSGNATYAAITAIVAANVLLVSYIVASVLEDSSSGQAAQDAEPSESRKSR